MSDRYCNAYKESLLRVTGSMRNGSFFCDVTSQYIQDSDFAVLAHVLTIILGVSP